MSTVETTEHPSTPSDLGLRFFLLGVFLVLVVDAITTVVNIGLWFAWSSCVLGIVSCLVMLFLANRLYGGDRAALTWTRLWVVLHLAIIAGAMAIALSPEAAESSFGRHVGINVLWEGYLKLAAYLLLGGLLFVPGVTLNYFSVQRGETPAAGAHAVEPSASSPQIELAADQTKALDGLGGAMTMASCALLTAGCFLLLTGLLTVGKTPAEGISSIIEGLGVLVLGGTLRGPAAALQKLLAAKPRDLGLAMKFLTICKDYVLVFLMLAVIMMLQMIIIVK